MGARRGGRSQMEERTRRKSDCLLNDSSNRETYCSEESPRGDQTNLHEENNIAVDDCVEDPLMGAQSNISPLLSAIERMPSKNFHYLFPNFPPLFIHDTKIIHSTFRFFYSKSIYCTKSKNCTQKLSFRRQISQNFVFLKKKKKGRNFQISRQFLNSFLYIIKSQNVSFIQWVFESFNRLRYPFKNQESFDISVKSQFTKKSGQKFPEILRRIS